MLGVYVGGRGGVGSVIHRQDQSPVTDARQAGYCQLLTSPNALPVPLRTISVGTWVAVGGAVWESAALSPVLASPSLFDPLLCPYSALASLC